MTKCCPQSQEKHPFLFKMSIFKALFHPNLLKLSLLLTELSVHLGNDFLEVSSLLRHGLLLLGQTVLHH